MGDGLADRGSYDAEPDDDGADPLTPLRPGARVPGKSREARPMTLVRATTMVALLCLLSVTTSAAAECAWVAWESSMSTGEVWQREGAFADRGSCLREARRVVSEMPHVKFDELVGEIAWRTGPVRAMRQCWPDTIDPRRPEGK
jgi:hypothetical protein